MSARLNASHAECLHQLGEHARIRLDGAPRVAHAAALCHNGIRAVSPSF